jgi:phytanoyl-CoA hydroxylase
MSRCQIVPLVSDGDHAAAYLQGVTWNTFLYRRWETTALVGLWLCFVETVAFVAAGAVPWHQDRSYWPGANANPVMTVWIPLVDATLVNGCLHIIPGTHGSGLHNHHRESYTGTGYTELDAEYVKTERVVPIPLEAGGAILFNDRCIHMSTPNRSQTVRWSVDLRYQPTDQDPMPQHGAGFLARSRKFPGRVATLEDWLASRPEHEGTAVPG